MNSKDMYIALMSNADDFPNVVEKLFFISRLDNSVTDDDFMEIKQVYFSIKKIYDKRKVGARAL